MNINKDDLRGHWKNDNNEFVFSFYPQEYNVEDFKCSINIDNSGKLLYDGDVYLDYDSENNFTIINAVDNKFIIKGFDKQNGYMSVFNENYGIFDVNKI